MAETSTGTVVENKLEAITKKPLTQQLVVTGQGLYNMFMLADQSNLSRMTWIRDYLVPNADNQQVSGALDEMVKIAHKIDMGNGVDEKTKGPKRNTAMQTRTHVQAIYGALKYASSQMIWHGYTAETGFNEARNMAKLALDDAGIIWRGDHVKTPEQIEQAKLKKARKAETDAQLEATKETPRAIGESMESWQARINDVATTLVTKAHAAKAMEDAQKALNGLTKKYDRDTLALIMEGLREALIESNKGQSEMSEEEANALLAAQAAGEVEIHAEEEQTV